MLFMAGALIGWGIDTPEPCACAREVIVQPPAVNQDSVARLIGDLQAAEARLGQHGDYNWREIMGVER